MNVDRQREALRQQMLLRALLGDARPGVVEGWLRGSPARKQRGLHAYRANAGALAERALAAACPTVVQLLGEVAFAALARAFWQARPPHQGDIATWGAELPAFIAADIQLAAEPYLADVAALDWALHQAERAADDDAAPAGLERLADATPQQLGLRLRAGHAVLISAHPLHAIWLAHRQTDEARFVAVRQAFAEGRADAVRVSRQGLRACVDHIAPDYARFELALLAGCSLAQALDAAATGFDFEAWFIDTLRHGRLAAVLPLEGPGP